MKKMKWLLAICLMLSLLLVAACRNNDGGTTPSPVVPPTPAPTPAPAPDADEDEPGPVEIVTLNWYMPGANIGDDYELVWAAVNEYLAPYGLAVNIISPLGWGELFDMAEIRLSSGDPMDIFYIYHGQFPRHVRRGHLLDMRPFLETEGADLLARLGEEFVSMMIVDGGIYKMPARGTALTPSRHWIFNADNADDRGIDVNRVQSFADMIDLLREIQDEFQYPTVTNAGHMTNTTAFHMLSDPFGIAVYEDELTVISMFQYEAVRENFRHVHTMVSEGLMHISDPVGSQAFTMELGHDNWFSLNQVYSGSGRSRFSLANTTGGSRIYTVPWFRPFATGVNFEGNVIGAQTNHPLEAQRFIYLLQTSEELNNIIAYGIEGLHWELNADGYVEFLEASSRFSHGAWQFGLDQFIRTPRADFPDLQAEYAVINAGFHIPPSAGFIVDPDNVTAELAAMRNLMDEFRQPLINGLVADVDGHIDTLLSRMELAGSQRVIDEIQSQFDAWRVGR